MVQARADDETLFREWQQLKLSKPSIEEALSRQGLSAEEISVALAQYERYRIARRNTIGWSLMGLGGFLGLVSCVLTMLDPLPDFRGFFMYGLTTVAVSIALYGCRLVLEKEGEDGI